MILWVCPDSPTSPCYETYRCQCKAAQLNQWVLSDSHLQGCFKAICHPQLPVSAVSTSILEIQKNPKALGHSEPQIHWLDLNLRFYAAARAGSVTTGHRMVTCKSVASIERQPAAAQAAYSASKETKHNQNLPNSQQRLGTAQAEQESAGRHGSSLHPGLPGASKA